MMFTRLPLPFPLALALRPLALLAGVLLAAALSAPLTAHAANVVIWPVDPRIAANEQATALWLENGGDAPVTLQVRSFRWSQGEDGDDLAAQDEIIASPPIAEVAPGQRQLVRLIRRTPSAGAEHAYRLLIDEVPTPPPATAAGDAPAAHLAVQMRYSIPLFTYAGTEATTPSLSARIEARDGARTLLLNNSGSGHARLSDLRLIAPNGHETVVKAGLAGYVLAGAAIRIALPFDAAGTIRVRVNGVEQTLTPLV